MSDSTSSENSEERAVTDSRVDLYFPRPIDGKDVPQITKKGFKPITVEEEENLLKQGTMTYYRGHLQSGCCEACDDALRASDKYARSQAELRPVEVQRHKYIDKRKTDCAMYKRGLNVPLSIETGFSYVKDDRLERLLASQEAWDKQHRQGELFNHLTEYFESVYHMGVSSLDIYYLKDIFTLMTIILEGDLEDLFFNATEDIHTNLIEFRKYASNVVEKIRIKILAEWYFHESANTFAVFSSIILVMLTEYSMRREVVNHFIPFVQAVHNYNDYNLTFKGMVKQLAKLPVLNERKRAAAKVKFEQSDSPGKNTTEEFKNKRKRFDKCPHEVTGRKLTDLD